MSEPADDEPKKICAACGLLKTYHNTRKSYCKDCCKEHERKWRARNPDKVKARTKEKAHDPERQITTSTYRKIARRSNPLYRDKELSANRRVALRKYGLTAEDWQKMADAQNNLCAICGKPETRKTLKTVRRLAVDHDHLTNNVRALLCGACNAGLGHFKDDASLMRKAIAYLEHHAGKSSASANGT